MDCTNLMPVVTIEVTDPKAVDEIKQALATFVEFANKVEGASVKDALLQGSGEVWRWKQPDTPG